MLSGLGQERHIYIYGFIDLFRVVYSSMLMIRVFQLAQGIQSSTIQCFKYAITNIDFLSCYVLRFLIIKHKSMDTKFYS